MGVRRESVFATTADGVALHLLRVVADDAPARGTRGAVVLQHGLGSNGQAFVVPGSSIAEHLAGLGYDCFVSDLRGAGQSARPAQHWRMQDYLELDVPTILAAAREHSGHAQLSWIGHSMGGVMMLLYGIDHPEVPIQRLVTVGTALDYRPGRNIYRSLRRLRPIASPLPTLPFGFLASVVSRVAGVGPCFLPEGMNFYRSNMDRQITRRLLASGFTGIPLRLLDDLSTAFDPDGLQLPGGEAYLPRAGAFRIPTLMLGGTRDPQCPPEATAASFELLTGVQHKQRMTFGKAHGQRDDYGHFDLLVGKHAHTEVWPHIAAFLDAGGQPAAQLQALVL